MKYLYVNIVALSAATWRRENTLVIDRTGPDRTAAGLPAADAAASKVSERMTIAHQLKLRRRIVLRLGRLNYVLRAVADPGF